MDGFLNVTSKYILYPMFTVLALGSIAMAVLITTGIELMWLAVTAIIGGLVVICWFTIFIMLLIIKRIKDDKR